LRMTLHVPPEFTLLRVEGPAVRVGRIRAQDLPEGWRERKEVTRALGTAWLEKGASVLLRVPSALVPATENLLFNPGHGDAGRFRVAEVFPWPFDARLKG
jgi:RES domain-containing protein